MINSVNRNNAVSFKGFERVIVSPKAVMDEDVIPKLIVPYLEKKAKDTPALAFIGAGYPYTMLQEMIENVCKISKRSEAWFYSNMNHHNIKIAPEVAMDGDFPIHLVYGKKDVTSYLKFIKFRLAVNRLQSKFYDLFCPKDLPRESKLLYGEIKAYDSISESVNNFFKKHNVEDTTLQKIQSDLDIEIKK